MMPGGLQKQIVEFPFGVGIDTKADSKVVKPPKLAGLENARIVNNETVNKRFGTTAVGTNSNGTKFLTKLFSFNGELIAAANASGGNGTVAEQLWGYNQQSGAWANKKYGSSFFQNFLAPCTVGVTDIVKNGSQQTCADSVTLNGYTYYVWEDTNLGSGVTIHLMVMNRSTGVFTSQNAAVVTGTRPKLCIQNNSFGTPVSVVFGYASSTNIVLQYVAQDGTLNSTVNMPTPLVANPLFDMFADATGSLFVAYNGSSGGNKIFIQKLNGFLALGTAVNIADTADRCITICASSQSAATMRMCWYSNTNFLRAASYDSSLTQKVAPWTVDTLTGTFAENICGGACGDGNNQEIVFAQTNGTATYNRSVKAYQIASGNVVALGSTLPSAGLASKPVVRVASNVRVMMIAICYDSPLQASYFLCQINFINSGSVFEVVAKILGGVGGGLTARAQVPNLMEHSTGNFSVCGGRKNRLASTGSTLFSILGVAEMQFSFATTAADWASKATPSTFGNKLQLCGGVLSEYDGQLIAESGFMLYPETPTVVVGAGGGLADGTYTFAQTYEYYDSKGNLQESTPSVSGTVVISGRGGAGSLTFTALCLSIGASQQKTTFTNIVIYLSDANLPNVLYRATDPVTYTFNTPTSNTISVPITISNATLVGRQTLYTTGGVQANFTPDGPSCSTVLGKNLIIDDPNDPTILRYSKLDTSRYGPHFAQAFTIPIYSDGGRANALISMDSRLIIFKQRQIWTCYGSGLDDLAGGQGFSVPQKLRDDIGCVGPQLLCEIPQGILFSSTKGIWLLRRDLGVTYAGAAVETYNSTSIRSFVHLKDQNQVRIALNDGTTVLVYDYFWTGDDGIGQWWSNTPYDARSAAVDSNGVFNFISPGANGFALSYQESAAFVDNHINAAPFITERITSGWYVFAGRQGYQRVFSISILGLLKSSHTLQVEIAYDYETSFSETHTITSANLTSNSSNYQGRIFPTRQRCQAIQLRISDISQSGTGESMTLTGVAFEIGVLPGAMRLPAAKSA